MQRRTLLAAIGSIMFLVCGGCGSVEPRVWHAPPDETMRTLEDWRRVENEYCGVVRRDDGAEGYDAAVAAMERRVVEGIDSRG